MSYNHDNYVVQTLNAVVSAIIFLGSKFNRTPEINIQCL